MTATAETPTRPDRRRPGRGGPPLPAPALAWAGLTVAGTVTFPGPGPTTDAATALATLQAHPVAAQLSAVLVLASAAPLAVFVAAAYQRMHVLGARVAGPGIGLIGGVLAASALALSGLLSWTAAAVAPVGDGAVVHALAVLSFAVGGAGFATAFALLVAGFAVPSLILRLVPRGVAIAGLGIAGVGVLALLSLLVPSLTLALPVVRFGGLLWLVTVSVLLPLSRRTAAER